MKLQMLQATYDCWECSLQNTSGFEQVPKCVAIIYFVTKLITVVDTRVKAIIYTWLSCLTEYWAASFTETFNTAQ
jgi:hypothetical protein